MIIQRSAMDPASGVEILGPVRPGYETILTPEALAFVADLTRAFRPAIDAALTRRRERRHPLDFLPETASVREAGWKIAPLPADLERRTVEITGPVDRKMIVNALNSGADVFMADFEDSSAPTWDNMVGGQIHLRDAARREIRFVDPRSGKRYELEPDVATLMVRPRGLHLLEAHMRVDGAPVPACLFDFGLYFFHNVRALLERGTSTYLYLPKLESHREARIWNDVFSRAETAFHLPTGTVRATVLVETLPAVFEMDEILYELRAHSAGLNCGRWDYIFSFLKSHQDDPERLLPDRSQVVMTQPCMRAYTQLVVRTCHGRGAPAIGGMAAQIPIKNDPAANEEALRRVRADKEREVLDGHDGTWVAHPALVAVAREVFETHMSGPNQLTRLREELRVTRDDLLAHPAGTRTEAGLRLNVRVGIRYLEAWLGGNGCVPLYHLMEDAATAEISRAQVWQWLHHRARLEDGREVTRELLDAVVIEEMSRIREEVGESRFDSGRFEEARDAFLALAIAAELPAFLTTFLYPRLAPASTAVGSAASQTDSATVPTRSGVTRTRSSSTRISEGERSMAERQHDSGTRPAPVRGDRLRDAMADRWRGIVRPYSPEDVERLRGTLRIEHSLARAGAERLWNLLHTDDYVKALGALTGNQAVQQVKAGLKAIYVSGWQVAADANQAGSTYPDQSLYPANSVPMLVRRINAALQRKDQIEYAERVNQLLSGGNGRNGNGATDVSAPNGNGAMYVSPNGNGATRVSPNGNGTTDVSASGGNGSTPEETEGRYWYAPIVADAEAGFGGPLNVFELMKGMIEAGAAGVHFEDQLSSEKKCGHLGGKVLVPTSYFVRTLISARLAADVMDVPTLVIARTDADSARLLTSDIDPRDHRFMTGERTPEGFFRITGGLACAIDRGLAYAPHADLLWCETSTPDLEEARQFAEAIHAVYPGKLLAYNCSPSFNWKKNLDDATIARFQRELGAMGYKFQFVTLAGFHSLNHGMFELACGYRDEGMTAYSRLQEAEFAAEAHGYSATRHQREVGTGYFDEVSKAIGGGNASTLALEESTETAQFK